jgi:uncharacterized membrane protein
MTGGNGGGAASRGRLGYLDWARGLCVVLMIHMHAFFGWVAPAHQGHPFYGFTRLIAGYPGAIFLFLAGLALALVSESARKKGAASRDVVRRGLRRGVEVLGYAFLFRLWMLASGSFYRPADLLRVDVLNCIAVSLLLVSAGVLGWPTARGRIAAAGVLTLAIALLTPVLWDNPALSWIPFPLRGYLGGHHPDWIYPAFPWAGFATLGAAAGVALVAARARGREAHLLVGLAVLGALLMPLGLALDRHGPALYARYDFWYTSPNYFTFKAGVVLLVLFAAYLLDRLPGGGPLRQLGTTSLIIYWVHLEIVYGQWIVPGARAALDVRQAFFGVVLLTLAMLALSYVRTGALRGRVWGRPAVAKADLA